LFGLIICGEMPILEDSANPEEKRVKRRRGHKSTETKEEGHILRCLLVNIYLPVELKLIAIWTDF